MAISRRGWRRRWAPRRAASRRTARLSVRPFSLLHLSATCPIGNLCRLVISHTENIRHRHVPPLLACAAVAPSRSKPLGPRMVKRASECTISSYTLSRRAGSRSRILSACTVANHLYDLTHGTRTETRMPSQYASSLYQLSLSPLSSLLRHTRRTPCDRDLSRPVNAFRESITALPIL